MTIILTQQDRRPAQSLPFCYYCGERFAPADDITRDHVPASILFAKAHRDPLVLPAHRACNADHEDDEQRLGQFVALKHGRRPVKKDRRVSFALFPKQALGAVTNINIYKVVWAWIRGFHAALYLEPLPQPTRSSLVLPFPSAPIGNRANPIVPLAATPPQHAHLVNILKTNRAWGHVDRIECNGGHLKYMCVWVQADSGEWMCVFALDVYDWKDMGNIGLLPERGCAGFYLPDSGIKPTNATTVIKSRVIVPNVDTLDAFGR